MLKNNNISIIIPTKNSIHTIEKCIESVLIQKKNNLNIEIIVIDNFSNDGTEKYLENISSKENIIYKQLGPERSEQRNYGIKISKYDIIGYIDSDMFMTKDLIYHILLYFDETNCDCVKVPEIIIGNNLLSKARRFERFLYCYSLIDSPRFLKKKIFNNLGYFKIGIPGAEDWELDSRIYSSNFKFGFLEKLLSKDSYIPNVEINYQYQGLIHDESLITINYLLKKKQYYKKADLMLINDLIQNNSKMINVFKIRYRLKLLFSLVSIYKYRWLYLNIPLLIIYRAMILLRIGIFRT